MKWQYLHQAESSMKVPQREFLMALAECRAEPHHQLHVESVIQRARAVQRELMRLASPTFCWHSLNYLLTLSLSTFLLFIAKSALVYK